ncbi:MAG: uroporphyrinogen-III synthase [Polyangiaceae bacterium]
MRAATMTLAGKTVLLTRARAQSETMIALLEAEHAKALIFPVIEIAPPEDVDAFRNAVAAMPSYSWIVFTSANGVRATFEEIDRAKIQNAFGDARIAVVGPATARELEARGMTAQLTASEAVGDVLANDLAARLAPNSRVLLLRAKVAREALPETLRAAGHTCDVVAAYETHRASPEDAEKIKAMLARGEIDFVTITSASTVEHLVALLGHDAKTLLAKTRIASIGPVTTDAARAFGLEVAVTASPHTADALVSALSSLK